MSRTAAWFQAFAMGIGGVGLFLIAFLDSSVLSLPEINDLLVIWMVIQHPSRMVYYASMATAGSVTGCAFLYWLARRGGEALWRKRARSHQLQRARALFERYGFLAVVVPAVLPPPAPFKAFILMAGLTGMPFVPFLVAVTVGRGLRYLAEGLLAVWYGAQAVAFLRAHTAGVTLTLLGVLLVGGGAYWLWRRGARTRTSDAVSER